MRANCCCGNAAGWPARRARARWANSSNGHAATGAEQPAAALTSGRIRCGRARARFGRPRACVGRRAHGCFRWEEEFSRWATAEAGPATWSFDRGAFWRRTIVATDAAGAVAGSFDPRALRLGGVLRWGDRALELRPASVWKERYALRRRRTRARGARCQELGRPPVRITVGNPVAVEPGVLLFAAFVVRQLADDASAAAGGGGR